VFRRKVIFSEKLFAMNANLTLLNGDMLTMNKKQPRVEALAVKAAKSLGVGSNSEIKQFCNPKTEKLDLKGKTVLPGFVASLNRMLPPTLSPGENVRHVRDYDGIIHLVPFTCMVEVIAQNIIYAFTKKISPVFTMVCDEQKGENRCSDKS
jgi:hypothetical protein